MLVISYRRRTRRRHPFKRLRRRLLGRDVIISPRRLDDPRHNRRRRDGRRPGAQNPTPLRDGPPAKQVNLEQRPRRHIQDGRRRRAGNRRHAHHQRLQRAPTRFQQ